MSKLDTNAMVMPPETDHFTSVGTPKFTTPEEFIKTKIDMFTNDFYINLTEEDIEYLKQFKTENTINAAVRTIINKYWKG